MGQCLSQCCEKQANLSPAGSLDNRGLPNQSNSRYLASELPADREKDPCGGGEPGSGNSDWKMFTPYSKLPPIKKQNLPLEVKKTPPVHAQVSESKIISLYDKYKDVHEDCILDEGIEKFCQDLEVKPEEFVVLVLAWKFDAATMCVFSKAEFLQGCRNLAVDSVSGIQNKFPELLAEVKEKQAFKQLYRWAYRFGLDNAGQRTLPTDMAISLWKLVFSQNEPSVLQRWIEFLQKHGIRGIPKDTWDMFLNFTEQVGDDLSSYDDTEAWPSLLDDFVEYENDRHNQNVPD